MKRVFLNSILSLLAFSLFLSSAHSETITVTTTLDEFGEGPGNCSLREAIQAANSNLAFGGCPAGDGADIDGLDTIILNPGTYTLNRPGLDDRNNGVGNFYIETSMALMRGQGSSDVFIVGNSSSSESKGGIFNITGDGRNVLLSGMTLGNGRAALGGAIYNNGANLSLSGVVVEENRADADGGALFNYEGTVTIERGSQIRKNKAVCGGGGIYNDAPGADKFSRLVIRGASLFEDNEVLATVRPVSPPDCSSERHDGGAIYNRGTVAITESTLRSNVAARDGGALYNLAGEVTIEKSTINFNKAKRDGGGLALFGSTNLNIVNSTIVANEANRNGGAIYQSSGTTVIRSSTIVYNKADANRDDAGEGGGIFNSGSITLDSSILFENETRSSETAPDCSGSIQSFVYSFLGNNANCAVRDDTPLGRGEAISRIGIPSSTLTRVNTDSEVRENGGPTQTVALLENSRAIDTGNPTSCPTTDQRGTDQRGIVRLRCDAGAFEFACGNGAIDGTLGEVCDGGNRSAGDGCRADCRGIEICRDGLLDVATGETCDDGNDENRDACTNACRIARCGDEIVRTGVEACDDGNTSNEDLCRNNCTLSSCGDATVNPGEACDEGTPRPGRDGNRDNPNATCRTNCLARRCGDGIIDPSFEEVCDDGNLLNTDNCPRCQPAICGDGFIRGGTEICDDGNTVAGDGCSANCLSNETCGNEIRELAEECDLGTLNSNLADAACRTDCRPSRCRDGIRDRDEACDDGNDDNEDACRNSCALPTCGNGQPDANEECDLGANNSDTAPDVCRTTCLQAFCGDGVRDQDEACDDGNPSNTDACLNACRVASCGDGFILEGVETCDGTGDCTANCTVAVGGGEGGAVETGPDTAGGEGDGGVDVGGGGAPPPSTCHLSQSPSGTNPFHLFWVPFCMVFLFAYRWFFKRCS